MENLLSMKQQLEKLQHGSGTMSTIEIPPMPCVDAYTFVTSPEYLGEQPFAFQRVALKTLYTLWDKYPADAEEAEFIRQEREEWGVDIDLKSETAITHLILVIGRRGGKTTLMSYVATYSVYQLICLGNPQKHYGLTERHPIHIMHVAGREEQAKGVFDLTRDKILRAPFFKPYIDFDKNNSDTIRIYTPYDLAMVARRQEMEGGEVSKRTGLPGSLFVESVPTVAATNRGKAIYVLMISEFAHLQRSGPDTSQQSDYEIFKGLSPSVKDFGTDGKIILESSPAEKGGEFYNQYRLAGGAEQDLDAARKVQQGYQLLQASTWQANPHMSKESLLADFDSDPVGARMEWGAHFADPSSSFIAPSLIKRLVARDYPAVEDSYSHGYMISVDPGGVSKGSGADAYAIVWGHCDQSQDCFWIDGLHGFDTQTRVLRGGVVERVAVDATLATDFVINLAERLKRIGTVLGIVYDQWNSQLPIALLEKSGFNAYKTNFDNSYKQEMVETFLETLNKGKVRIGSNVDPIYVERLALELKYLQREVTGGTVKYHHPSTGKVVHDDFAWAVMNLNCQLVRHSQTIGTIVVLFSGSLHIAMPSRRLLSKKKFFSIAVTKRRYDCPKGSGTEVPQSI